MRSHTPGARFLIYLLILITIFFSTWQDFFLAENLGEIFRTPLPFLLPVFFIVELYYYKKSPGKTYFKKINYFFKWVHILYIIISVLNLAYWILTNGSDIIYGENILLKTIKVLTYYSLLWIVFRSFYFLLYKSFTINLKVDKIFILLTTIYIVILIIEYLTLPYAFPLMHSTADPYYRIRLFTVESSWTGSIALLLITGVFYNGYSYYKILFALFFILVFTITSGSKQFLSGLILAFALFSIIKLKKNIGLVALIIILILPLIYLYVTPLLFKSFQGDVENYTSVATRLTSFVTSLKFPFIFPLGTGGMYFYYFAVESKKTAMDLKNLFPILNFQEIMGLGQENAKAISPKSTLGDMFVFLGIPGVYLLIYFFKSIYSGIKENAVLFLLFLYFIITGLTSESIQTKPNEAIFLSLLIFHSDYLNLKMFYE